MEKNDLTAESQRTQRGAEIIQLDKVVGKLPYRVALAGGWIDQPFISRQDPEPPGSMVVAALEPTFRYMDRAGMATSTRKVAMQLWNDRLPERDPAQLVRELYAEENRDKPEPSGSQDMIGLVYPGINRLDYDAEVEGGYFPRQVESCRDPQTIGWLEKVITLLPVAQRPPGYNPLGIQNLDPAWVRRLGQSGKDCFEAILSRDTLALGAALNECMRCWEALLPHTVRHPAITVDLMELLRAYQAHYPGAMYSGCGGGYLIVVSEEPVAGGIKVKVRG
jgi:hypothetical protein